MDSLKESYGKYLHEFIDALATGFPDNEAVKRVHGVKDKLEHEKHIVYFRKQLEDIREAFIKKDESIFDEPRPFIPTVDVSALWKTAAPDHKAAIWKYLQTLYLLSEQITASEHMDTEAMDQIIKNLQETAPSNFNIEDILGGDDNPLSGKMNDLVKNLASSFQDGNTPLSALQDPSKLQNIFSQVESQVKSMCDQQEFNENDLKDYAENMKSNLESKLNMPLDSLMQNVQGMLNPTMLDMLMKNMKP